MHGLNILSRLTCHQGKILAVLHLQRSAATAPLESKVPHKRTESNGTAMSLITFCLISKLANWQVAVVYQLA